jgi:hypothetical protein
MKIRFWGGKMNCQFFAINLVLVSAIACLPHHAIARVESINAPNCHGFLEKIEKKYDAGIFWSADWVMGWVSAKADTDKFDLANQSYGAIIRRLEAICLASMPKPLNFTDVAPQIYRELRQSRFKCPTPGCF